MTNKPKVHYFEYIPAEPKEEAVLTRLGYRKSSTVLDSKNQELLARGIREANLLCRPRGVLCRLKIMERDISLVTLENNIELASSRLAEMLKSCGEVVLICATVGKEVTERISEEVTCGNASLGLVMDAAASQKTDACLDWMVGFVNKLMQKEGRITTSKRYSPGYGDFDLANQRTIYNILKLEKLDLALTEKFMLVPEKSVTAVAGIKENRSL